MVLPVAVLPLLFWLMGVREEAPTVPWDGRGAFPSMLCSVPATLSQGALWKHASTSFVLKITMRLPASWAPYQLCIQVQAICLGYFVHMKPVTLNAMFLYVLVCKRRFMLPPLAMTISVMVLPTQAPNLVLCTQDLFTCKVCTWEIKWSFPCLPKP